MPDRQEIPKTKPWWISDDEWGQIQAASGSWGRQSSILFNAYFRMGGAMGKLQFQEAGFPSPPTAITPRARDILAGPEGQFPLPRGVTVAPPPPSPLPTVQERIATREAADIDITAPPTAFPTPTVPAFPTAPTDEVSPTGEAPPSTETLPEGYGWRFDRETNRWVPQFTGLTEFQKQQQERAETEFQAQQEFQQQQLEFQQQQQAQGQAQFQQQLQFQQEQARMAQEEQERQYRSQLAAQPISWLQYAAYTGEQPVIQPWMVPLGFQNQGGIAPQGQVVPEGQLQAGQPIPGFEGQAGQRGIQTFANLPQLTTPSAQLQARWGPTAQAQFLGYRQARTGALPQETQFRLGAGRAPAGRFTGFSRFR